MFENARFFTMYYTAVAYDAARQGVENTKEFAAEHKSEMTRTAAITSVVYLGARINGFKAGYEYAKTVTA